MGVTWADSPATTSPVDAANLNTLLQNDGSVASTAAQPVDQALSGSTKVFADWNATDGKRYQIRIFTSGALVIWNQTDSVAVAQFSASGALQAGGSNVPVVGAHSTSAFTLSAGAGVPGALAVGEIYFQLS